MIGVFCFARTERTTPKAAPQRRRQHPEPGPAALPRGFVAFGADL